MNGPNNPIGWTDWTWNPIKGLCPVGCEYCYARRIYDRFHYDPTIRLDEKELQAPFKLKEPSRIFVGSTIELFGEWVSDNWIERILKVCRENPQQTFQFLTKNPQRLKGFNFPINCWLGVTITTQEDKWKQDYLAEIDFDRYHDYERKHTTFLSYEPLHGDASGWLCGIRWVIIGAETGNRKGKVRPKKEWIKNILYHANYWNVPVFMKDNLKPYWNGVIRQEFPFRGLPIR